MVQTDLGSDRFGFRQTWVLETWFRQTWALETWFRQTWVLEDLGSRQTWVQDRFGFWKIWVLEDLGSDRQICGWIWVLGSDCS